MYSTDCQSVGPKVEWNYYQFDVATECTYLGSLVFDTNNNTENQKRIH